jgi:hypothetical protein
MPHPEVVTLRQATHTFDELVALMEIRVGSVDHGGTDEDLYSTPSRPDDCISSYDFYVALRLNGSQIHIVVSDEDPRTTDIHLQLDTGQDETWTGYAHFTQPSSDWQEVVAPFELSDDPTSPTPLNAKRVTEIFQALLTRQKQRMDAGKY